jgi:hypothetical protein
VSRKTKQIIITDTPFDLLRSRTGSWICRMGAEASQEAVKQSLRRDCPYAVGDPAAYLAQRCWSALETPIADSETELANVRRVLTMDPFADSITQIFGSGHEFVAKALGGNSSARFAMVEHAGLISESRSSSPSGGGRLER